MAAKDIKRVCSSCGGSGKAYGVAEGPPYDPIEADCPRCEGSGELSSGYLSDDLVDRINDILDKCNDILERVSE